MEEVIGDKYVNLTYYVHLDGIKGRNILQECMELKSSKLSDKL